MFQTIECPHCKGVIEVENVQRRGQLAGLTLEEMTNEQLQREIINSKSVLYKAKKRGADDSTVLANQARVDAALAEKEKRTPKQEEAAPKQEEAAPKKEKK